mmetsp:Transcript_4212/g.8502  ORF Transcript_4212/g.8502 Transcript_4212/m.8502 type:complete len:491 (+) Transcript_4212:175-1647(+)
MSKKSILFTSLLLSFLPLLFALTPPIAKIHIVASSTITSPFGASSPVPPPTFFDAAVQVATKVMNCDERIDVSVSSTSEGLPPSCDLLLSMGVEPSAPPSPPPKGRFVLSPPSPLSSSLDFVDSFDPTTPSLTVPWSSNATASRLYAYMTKLFSRFTTDDYTTAILLFVNQYSGHKVPWVQHSIDPSWEKGPVQNVKEFASMMTKCRGCITACLADEQCKACIDALNEIDTRDQVESYRAVTSFESTLLRDFSFCILEKNNIFECSASIPALPPASPIATFRGEPLTHDAASRILIGHLDDADGLEDVYPKGGTSWVVACGANVAYDQFPNQNQLFYKGKGTAMWYDPVFKVKTLDGRVVWCKRHYKVRRVVKTPGQFMLSVLDNGVTSNERWNIVAVADDLSWCVFHYAGAASAVGQSYTGGLLCTRDGSLPPTGVLNGEIKAAFQSVDIQLFELFVCDNSITAEDENDPPPLNYYRKDDAVKWDVVVN